MKGKENENGGGEAGVAQQGFPLLLFIYLLLFFFFCQPCLPCYVMACVTCFIERACFSHLVKGPA